MMFVKNILRKILYRINPSRKNEEILLQNNKFLREILFSSIFNDSIRNVSWIKDRTFSASGASANYSFLYILFKILDLVKPKSILELGMGESSKLSFQYVNSNLESRLFCVDDNSFWMNLTKDRLREFNKGNIKYLLLGLKDINFNNFKIKAYDNLLSSVFGEKFDLLIIDGPHGNKHFSRVGALDLLDSLMDDFVIIVDDCDRQGEKELAEEIMRQLVIKDVKFYYTVYRGIKFQYIIFSQKFSYLKTI